MAQGLAEILLLLRNPERSRMIKKPRESKGRIDEKTGEGIEGGFPFQLQERIQKVPNVGDIGEKI